MSISLPENKDEFKAWCLRRLGAPVLEINIDADQVEDCVQYALKTYWDYHFDGTDKVYYKYPVTSNNHPHMVSELEIINGGTGYQNTDTIVIDAYPVGSETTTANATLTTDANGTIISTNIVEVGAGYMNEPTVSINTGTGSNAVIKGWNGGYVPIPDNIIGAVNIFDIGYHIGTNNLFNIRYQIALNDLYTLTSVSMVPYFMAFQHIQFLEYMLVGRQPIRYQRHKNKLYLDLDWGKFAQGSILVAECYQIVDPDVYKDAWNDRWLMNYAAALMKKQWGTNLKKFSGVQLTGGIQFNGQQIYDEASAEVKALEDDMIRSYSLPALDMIG